MASVGGPTSDTLLGDVVGDRALRFRAELASPQEFHSLSSAVLRRWQERRYIDAFKWVDNITPVDDEVVVQRLRDELMMELRKTPVSPDIDVLLPDDLVALDDDRSIHYVAFPRERGASKGRKNLTIGSAAKLAVREDDRSPTRGLDAPLRFFDAAEDEIDSLSLLECLCAQLDLGGETFVLYDGDFFAVDGDFLSRINKDIESIPEPLEAFPPYGEQTEGQYLEAIKNDSAADFAVLDKALIRVDNETPVEPCDLVGRTGALIHVKRKGRSALFSHLCFQATNSCSLLSHSEEAQNQLFEKIKISGAPSDVIDQALDNLEALRDRRQVTATFAILGRWGDRTVTSLPLLSKISLSQAHRRIGQLGFRATLKLIDVGAT